MCQRAQDHHIGAPGAGRQGGPQGGATQAEINRAPRCTGAGSTKGIGGVVPGSLVGSGAHLLGVTVMDDDDLEIPRFGKLSPETINRIGAMATSFVTNKKPTADFLRSQWADVEDIKDVLGDEKLELLRLVVEYAMIDSFQRFRFLDRFNNESRMNDAIKKKVTERANRIANKARRAEQLAKRLEAAKLRDPAGTVPVWMAKK